MNEINFLLPNSLPSLGPDFLATKFGDSEKILAQKKTKTKAKFESKREFKVRSMSEKSDVVKVSIGYQSRIEAISHYMYCIRGNDVL